MGLGPAGYEQVAMRVAKKRMSGSAGNRKSEALRIIVGVERPDYAGHCLGSDRTDISML